MSAAAQKARAAVLAGECAALNQRGAAKALEHLCLQLAQAADGPRPLTVDGLLDALTFSLALGVACQPEPRVLRLDPIEPG